MARPETEGINPSWSNHSLRFYTIFIHLFGSLFGHTVWITAMDQKALFSSKAKIAGKLGA